MRHWRKVMRWGFIVIAGFILVIFLCNLWVVKSTESRVFTGMTGLPNNTVALVLGTSSKLMGGSPNPFFVNRIETAAQLYKMGKVKHLIVSGDNRTKYYNEPLEMKNALIALGVPDSAITLDFAGLRTLDSIVRSKLIFGQQKLTIITQPFHSYRALFISSYYNIDAVAVVAREPEEKQAVLVYIREFFARTKAILDVYVFGTSPQQLGEKEPLNI